MAVTINIHTYAQISFNSAPSGSPVGVTINYILPATTAKLSWTPVPKEQRNGIITGYDVYVKEHDSGSTQEILVEEADATSVEVSNLNPLTLYHFSISAKTKAGSGPVESITSQSPENSKTYTSSYLDRIVL